MATETTRLRLSKEECLRELVWAREWLAYRGVRVGDNGLWSKSGARVTTQTMADKGGGNESCFN